MAPLNHLLLCIQKRIFITTAANVCHSIGTMASSVPVFTSRFGCSHFSTTSNGTSTTPSMPSPNPTADELAEFAKRIPIKKRSLTRGMCKNKDENDVEQEHAQRFATVPNLICVLRIAVTPLIGLLVIHQQFLFACVLFVFISFTDILDGFIARHFPSQRSLLGSFLDPLADKFLIGTLFITLSYMQLISVPVTIIVFARDLFLVLSSFWMRYKMLDPPFTVRRFFDPTISAIQVQPSSLSKYNTFIQLSLVSLSLAAPIFDINGQNVVLQFLQLLTVTTTVLSGVQYALRSGVLRVKSKPK